MSVIQKVDTLGITNGFGCRKKWVHHKIPDHSMPTANLIN